MKPLPDREEEILLDLLEGRPFPRPKSTEDEVLERSLADTLGLLAQSLEPIAPSPESRRRVLEAVRGAGRAQRAGGTLATGLDGRSQDRGRHPRAGWPLALAASLALAAICSTAWFYQELGKARSQLALRQAEIADLVEQERSSRTRLAQLSQEMSELSERFNLVLQTGAIACPLLPQGKQNAQLAAARGVLYIAGDKQHWFLKVSGLPELPPGRAYHLWFLTQRGPMSAGSFRNVADGNAELGSPEMPVDMMAVALTVEPEGDVTAPTGDRILFGHEKVQLL